MVNVTEKKMFSFNHISIFVIFFISTSVIAEDLRCYVCIDCDTVNEAHEAVCYKPGQPDTETPGTTTDEPITDLPVISTTVSTNEQTTVESTTDVTDGESTTESSSTDAPNGGQTTEGSGTDTTTDAPSTDESSTDSDAPSTDESSTDAPDSEAPSTDDSSTDVPTDESTTEVTNSEVPPIDESSTEEANNEIPSTNESGTDAPNSEASIADGLETGDSKVLSSVGSNLPNSETYYNVEMVNNNNGRRALLRTLREIKNSNASSTRCVVTSFLVANKTMIVRGCSFTSGNDEERCREMIGGFGGDLTRCSVCEGNLCNAAAVPGIALIPLLIAMLLSV